MSNAVVGTLAGVAGLVLAGVALFVASSAKPAESAAHGASAADLDALTDKVTRLEGSVAELSRKVGGLAREPRGDTDRLAELEARVDKLAAGVGAVAKPVAASPDDAVAAAAKASDELAELQKKLMSGDASPDEQQRFWQLLRERPEILAAIMKDLEKAVGENPHDHDARMKLARAYVTKLLTVPSGPEMGAWSMKAMNQYQEILKEDPNHWDARYSLAFNYSQWPDFLNKTPDAIKEFEKLRKVQESQTPDAKHAGTYLQLSKLYLKTGKADAAKQVLEDGLRRHPDDEELKKALDAAK